MNWYQRIFPSQFCEHVKMYVSLPQLKASMQRCIVLKRFVKNDCILINVHDASCDGLLASLSESRVPSFLLASNPGFPFRILSLQSCETKSGTESLGSRLAFCTTTWKLGTQETRNKANCLSTSQSRFKDAWSFATAMDSVESWNELAVSALHHLEVDLGEC